ncbi:MAG: hypothetical protein BGN96_15925 [Bacteroidales bacterium 45-6]|nr:MAG: hypothetical protein BGN96_15925 [Bacteroidales bacterium 45-6]
MANITEIKEMLDAFYKGETSREEEARLQAYFSDDDLPVDMQREKAVFQALFEQEAVPAAAEGMETRLSSLIDQLERNESKRVTARKPNKKKKLWLEIGGIAASICLLVSIGMFVMNQGHERNSSATESANPASKLSREDQQKIKEAQKALEMVSTNFNKGMDGMQSVSENL